MINHSSLRDKQYICPMASGSSGKSKAQTGQPGPRWRGEKGSGPPGLQAAAFGELRRAKYG